MNKTIKFIIFFIAIFAISFFVPNFSKAATPVTDESSLLSAISSVGDGETILGQFGLNLIGVIIGNDCNNKFHNICLPLYTVQPGNRLRLQLSAGQDCLPQKGKTALPLPLF